MAAEISLVTHSGHSCDTSNFFRKVPFMQQLVGYRRRDWHQESLSRCPLHLLCSDSPWAGWGAHLQDLTATGTWISQKKELHINMIEMEVVKLVLNVFLCQIIGETWSYWSTMPRWGHIWRNMGHSIAEHVQAGPGAYWLVRASHDHYRGQVHSREKERSGRPVKLSGSCSSHGVGFFHRYSAASARSTAIL